MAGIAAARRTAYQLLQAIELQGWHSDDALHGDTVSRLAPVDRRLTTELVLGTLRWRGWLDFVVSQVSEREWPRVDPTVQILLRMSLYQISRMDRMPDYAVVNDATALAKLHLRPGPAAFVNAVLRRLSKARHWTTEGFRRSCPPWVRCSLPQWLWGRWSARWGPSRTESYALSLNRPPQPAVWTKGDLSGDQQASLEEVSTPSEFVPGAWLLRAGESTPSLAAGLLHIQDESSQLIPHLFGSLEGKRIWDACAAPGGKLGILRLKAGPAGMAVGSDSSAERLRLARSLLGIRANDSCPLLVADSLQPPPFRGYFDAVLADVPCSGLGTLRRNPEAKWRLNELKLEDLARIQRAILSQVSSAVRPGGLLLYSTCSTEPEENENNVDWFLEANRAYRLCHPTALPAISPWLDERGLLRSFPSERAWDGFFAALMLRLS